MSSNKKYVIGYFIAISGSILFSTKAILVKLSFTNTHIDALSLLMLRMLFSIPFYVGAAFISKRKQQTPITKKQWINIISLGLIGYYASSLFDFIGLQYISAGLERLILFIYPMLAVILNATLHKHNILSHQKIAMLLTYLGILLAYGSELNMNSSATNINFGSFMVLLCAITYAFYLVGTGKMVQQVGTTRYTAYAMLSATVGIFTHYLLVNSSFTLPRFDSTLLTLSILLALIATVIPSFMLSYGMKTIGSNNVALITSIGPVSTIIQAYFFLHEPLHVIQIIGTLLVIVGVIIVGKKGNQQPVTEPEVTEV